MNYHIYIDNQMIAEVSGSEACYVCYEAAKSIAEMTGRIAHIVSGETGEILESSEPLEGCTFENCLDNCDKCGFNIYDDYDECGFDPYEGCYTYDC
jgi:hypothetical protein